MEQIKEWGDIEKAIAYGASFEGQANEFKNALKDIGFELQYKEPKVYTNRRKADWDVGIAIDIVRHMHMVDCVVLGSADSDMIPAVDYLHEHGRTCYVYACKISKDLKNVADRWFEIPDDCTA